MAHERVIKKYANRRLYDAAESRHVTLEDLRKLIVQGEKIKVVDDKTGEDLTRSILLQIIADQEQFGQPILSTSTLESIIRFYGDAMQGFMGRYLEQAVSSFVSQQQALQNQISRMVSGTPLASMADLAQANLAMWQQMQENIVSALKPRTPTPPPAPAAPPPAAHQDTDDEPQRPAGSTRRPRGGKKPGA
ncbi:MAG: polyhydroxyalkanoate synthesis repressor PhaR [Steroidobacteraceae bacterium]|jgi:polyhydroxyalkanoate synthesis repressor PhaR|nr:polyhydroxyalkanoate synthesis repressor PhaR [Steroidobacteraceae bacterium]